MNRYKSRYCDNPSCKHYKQLTITSQKMYINRPIKKRLIFANTCEVVEKYFCESCREAIGIVRRIERGLNGYRVKKGL